MADYRFIIVWRIEAPIHNVCAAIQHAVHWPQSWKGAEKVEGLEPGDDTDVDSVPRCMWKSRPPYQLTFDVRVTGLEPLALVEAVASGELEGIGCWRCSHHESVSVVRYDWQLCATRRLPARCFGGITMRRCGRGCAGFGASARRAAARRDAALSIEFSLASQT